MDINQNYREAVKNIKEAILRSQYRAVASVNKEQLSLYYGIGRYVSENSRTGFWGKGAIEQISSLLQKELPGLRGFSVSNIKNMRVFYEEWEPVLNRQPAAGDLVLDEKLLLSVIRQPLAAEFNWSDFLSIGFSHHTEIISKAKTLEARLFYIHECAIHYWSKYTLRDLDEKIVEKAIVANVKKFIMTFGQDFSFIGNQYRVEVAGEEMFIDLLFFNRELNSLVAVELKSGKFRTSYLGQLNTYLSALDTYIRKPHENPSIGIILCREMNQTFVEFAVRDYNKPMGVATYRASKDMPERLRNALPDIEDLKKLL